MDYEPGKQVKEKELQEEFDIGRTPLREIFIKLEADGLIRTAPQRGTYVSTVSFDELRNLFEVRSYLIGLAGQLAARRAKKEHIEELKRLVKRLKKETEPKKLMKLDAESHEIINRATSNKILAKHLRKLRHQTIRIWIFPRQKGFMDNFGEEYSQLVPALEMGDEKRSRDILVSHIHDFIKRIKDQFIPVSPMQV